MRSRIIFIAIILITFTALAQDTSWLPTATIKFGSPYSTYLDTMYEEIATYQCFVSQFKDVFDPYCDGFRLSRLHNDNPDINVMAYVSVHSITEWNRDSAEGSYGKAWWDMGVQHLAYTNSEPPDTFSTWNKNSVINLTDSTTVDDMIQVWLEFGPPSYNYNGDMSFMMDHFTYPLNTQATGDYLANINGDLDLDQDGQGLAVYDEVEEEYVYDDDEMQALFDGYCYLADQVAVYFPDTKIIANGNLPRYTTDKGETFRGKIHGIFIEGSGKYYTNGAKGLLDKTGSYYYDSLQNDFLPGGFSIFESLSTGTESVNHCLALAMMFDDVYAVIEDSTSARTLGPSMEAWNVVGAPTGNRYRYNDQIWVRDFENGQLYVWDVVTDRDLWNTFSYQLKTLTPDSTIVFYDASP